MKVTLDTNVLLSATFWYGDSSRVFEMAENGKIEIILSEEIITELSQVFEYEEIKNKVKNKGLLMKRTIAQIKEMSTIINPTKKLNIIKEDPDDNKIIECAVEGKADFIISNDKHLLNLKKYKGILILTPKDFLEMFNQL